MFSYIPDHRTRAGAQKWKRVFPQKVVLRRVDFMASFESSENGDNDDIVFSTGGHSIF